MSEHIVRQLYCNCTLNIGPDHPTDFVTNRSFYTLLNPISPAACWWRKKISGAISCSAAEMGYKLHDLVQLLQRPECYAVTYMRCKRNTMFSPENRRNQIYFKEEDLRQSNLILRNIFINHAIPYWTCNSQ